MPKKPTTVWIKIDQIVPHPDNANQMSDEQFAVLEANIGEGPIPPILARSLELSQAFEEERELDKVQILDGEHRWKLAMKRGDKDMEVRVWGEITDGKAKQILLTMNHGGDDDKAKRARLIRDMHEIEPDAELLATILPETAQQIKKIVDEINLGAVTDATVRAKKISEREPMTIFVVPKQAEVIRRAIKVAQARMDEEHQHVECEEGEALAAVARGYIEGIEARTTTIPS